MDRDAWLIYGATGYTGRLIAAEAAKRGMQPVLAGRSAAIQALGEELRLKTRRFDLKRPDQIAEGLDSVRLVLNCAGPFSRTARPLIEACLSTHCHYLDITGEIDVIEHAAAQGNRANAARVALVPAVGFDVVPTDCLAALLAARLPNGVTLQLAFAGLTSMSPGTAKTALESLPRGGRARIDGRIERVPIAWKAQEIPFREGPRCAMTIPWGDVASAYYTTGIPNIEVYSATSSKQLKALRRWRFLLPMLGLPGLRSLAAGYIQRRMVGPTEEARQQQRASLWGRVEDAYGKSVEATMTTPNGYSLTVLTALAAVERLLAASAGGSGELKGFLTPAKAFGGDFVLSIPGVDLQWLE